MPMGKIYKFKRKSRPKKKTNVIGLQKQVNTINRKIKKEAGIYAHAITAGTFSDTMSITHRVPTEDTGGSNGITMDGEKATLLWMRFRGFVQAASATPKSFRIDVVLDKLPVGGTTATRDLIYGGTAAPMTTLMNMKNPHYYERFKILMSIAGIVSTGGKESYVFDRVLRINRKIETKSTTYAQANQTKNAILLVLWSDDAADQPTYQIGCTSCLIDDN